MITRKQLIKKYIEFFKSQNHKEIPNESLIPENDPTVLFTTAGMHPLVPYLLGQPHPLGKRVMNVQRCIRTGDIEEVGNSTHHTFFEMIGNWSFGDYFKEEAIKWSFEFAVKILKLKKERLAVSVFGGDKRESKVPVDQKSAEIWASLGMSKDRITFLKGGIYESDDNWWGPAGKTGPCGPCTEMFYWKPNDILPPKNFDPEDKRWVEIWNDVIMEYIKDKRLILVDGMYCLYDEKFNPNRELLHLVNNFNSHNILAVNGFREKGRESVKNYDMTKDTNWGAFSLEEEKIKKDNPEYFKILLKKFNLTPEEVIYFDHDKTSVETAKKLGILSKHYTNIKSIKKFIEDNLWAYFPAKQKNIDNGRGLERILAVVNNLEDNYLTEIWQPIIKQIEHLSNKSYSGNEKEMRIIADHIKASVFILADGIVPGNTEQGYILRRLIRRAIMNLRKIGFIGADLIRPIARSIFPIYDDYPHLQKNKKKILQELEKEEEAFEETLEKGLTKFNKMIKGKKELHCKDAFLLYQSFGFPIEMTIELAKEKGIKVDEKGFEKECQTHQELSRTASAGKFKSGLADNSEATTKLHTATHLLLEALRTILKNKNIMQKGSNITHERLRLDFNFNRKLTKEELQEVEDLVNAQIQKSYEVKREEMSPEEAKKKGAIGIFDKKYSEKVSVYAIENFSKEICAGPHVKNTCEIGHFKIKKESSSSSGIRRIKAIIE
ncbi:MAG: alanine--tRNA ligase-related protein [archaeon]